jgi:hypothetical protein
VGGFRAARGRDAVVVSLDEIDITVLRSVLDELLELLDDGAPEADADPLAAALGIGTSTKPSDDPVLARLFPDGYRDDDEAASEFRRYTEVGLRETKRAQARTVLATLDAGPGKHTLDRDGAQAWMVSLNDLRLAIGTRLEITEDWDEQVAALDEDDPRRYAYAVYDHLTFFQESLVQALMRLR